MEPPLPLPSGDSKEFRDLPEKHRVEYAVAIAFSREYNVIQNTSYTPFAFGADNDGIDFICKDSAKSTINLQIRVLESVDGHVAAAVGRDNAALRMGWTRTPENLMLSPMWYSGNMIERLQKALEEKFKQRPGINCALVLWHIDPLDTDWDSLLSSQTAQIVQEQSPYDMGVWLMVGSNLNNAKLISLGPVLLT